MAVGKSSPDLETALDVDAALRFVAEQLFALADPVKATEMARYMKTEMPFYGVQKPARTPVLRELTRRWRPTTRAEYTDLVLGLWSLPHREEKYLALGVARSHDRFVTKTSVPLYRHLMVEGAWWDLVDEVATKLSGRVMLRQRALMTPTILGWIESRNLWLRRAALLAQIGHRDATDEGLLFHCCLARAHETEFFIRKAIGWALRDYARTAPEAVVDFVGANEAALSGLSKREAMKNL